MRKILTQTFFILFAVVSLAVFMLKYEIHTTKKIKNTSQQYSKFISNDLWNMDKKASKERLNIILSSNKFTSLTIYNIDNSIFVFHNNKQEISKYENLLINLKLIRPIKFKEPIIYKSKLIGYLEVIWLNKNIYLYFYLLLILILIQILIKNYFGYLKQQKKIQELKLKKVETAFEITESKLEDSEKKYKRMIKNARNPIIITDEKGGINRINTKALELLNIDISDIDNINFYDFYSKSFSREIQNKISEESNFYSDDIYLFNSKNEKVFIAQSSTLNQFRDKKLVFHSITNIQKMKESEKIIINQKNILEMIAKMSPRNDILNEITKCIESFNKEYYCTIMLVDEESSLLKNISSQNIPIDFISGIDEIVIGNEILSIGNAICSKEKVLSQDISNDSNWKDYSDWAVMNFEIRSCYAIPILSNSDHSLGVLAIFSKEINGILDNSLDIIDSYANLVSITLEKEKSDSMLKESKERWKSLVESIPNTVSTVDHKGKLIFINKFKDWPKESIEEVKGLPIYDKLEVKYKEIILIELAKIFKNGKNSQYESSYVDEEGERTWYSNHIAPIKKDGDVVEAIIISEDVTEKKDYERMLIESQERYELAAKGANDGLWDWDIRNKQVYYSLRWLEMLGYKKGEVEDTIYGWHKLIHQEDLVRVKTELDMHIDGLVPHFESEYRIKHKNNNYIWVRNRGLAIKDGKGSSYRMAGSQTNITPRKIAEERLLHDSLYDSVTNLPNRKIFMESLNKTLDYSKKHENYLFAVLALDIDRFQIVNDNLGHMVGDKLLFEISRRLENCLLPGDSISRFAGDEYVILLDNLKSIQDAIKIAQRIQLELEKPLRIIETEIFATVSIGIVVSYHEYKNSEEILRDANIAMYKAKSSGKACYQVFQKEMYNDSVGILKLETDLRRAIERNELELYYQPIISLVDDELEGFEALIRWKHTEQGIISADKFIPIAEETGLIINIGDYVLREACIQLKKWKKQFGKKSLTLNVNISAKQLNDPNLSETITNTIREIDVDPKSIKLEITESVVMQNTEFAMKTLDNLRSIGIKICIDDFGTGYSSLSYLHKFPINTLKIDRSFVNKICSNNDNLEIVRTIISLSHSLNMNVVAEGIENDEQLQVLKDLGCESGQGFFFSKPVKSSLAEKLLLPNMTW